MYYSIIILRKIEMYMLNTVWWFGDSMANNHNYSMIIKTHLRNINLLGLCCESFKSQLYLIHTLVE